MQKATLKIYREIWDWNENSAVNFINRLNALDNQGLDVINLHVHCKGGDVLEGIAIYNAIKNANTPVDLYVDGVAASMMTIIMLACRRIYMAENAFLMIHAPSGGAWGTAKVLQKAANALKSMEQNFKLDYARRTGKTEAEVSAWLDGDNWFSAKQALEQKLIDGVVSAVDTKAEPPRQEDIKSMSATMMYQRFAALMETSEQNNNSSSNKSKINMDKSEIIKNYGLTSVTADSSDDAIFEAMAAKIREADTARTEAENKLKTEKESQVKAMVAAAKQPLSLTPGEITEFEKIGISAGVEALQMVLSKVKPMPTITGMINNSGSGNNSQTQDPKTFSELVALGESVLADWKKNREADYKRLYKAEFGHDFEKKEE